MDKLKPCPFCGGKAEVFNVREGRPYWQVKCQNRMCGAMSRVVKNMTWSTSPEYEVAMRAAQTWAIEAWNRRASDA